jgi:hypothetical protein
MTGKNYQDPDLDPEQLDSGVARLFGLESALRYNAGSESLRTMLIRNAGRK